VLGLLINCFNQAWVISIVLDDVYKPEPIIGSPKKAATEKKEGRIAKERFLWR
jgi:hypothetical protein